MEIKTKFRLFSVFNSNNQNCVEFEINIKNNLKWDDFMSELIRICIRRDEVFAESFSSFPFKGYNIFYNNEKGQFVAIGDSAEDNNFLPFVLKKSELGEHVSIFSSKYMTGMWKHLRVPKKIDTKNDTGEGNLNANLNVNCASQKLDLNEFVKIFNYKLDTNTKTELDNRRFDGLKNFFVDVPLKSQLERMESPLKCGVLNVRSIPESQIWELITEQKYVVVQKENEFLLLKFCKDSANEPTCGPCTLFWDKQENSTYKCEEVNNISVKVNENGIFLRRGEDMKSIKSIGVHTDQTTKEEEINQSSSVNSSGEVADKGIKTKLRRVEQDIPTEFVKSPPTWFSDYMKDFKVNIIEEVTNMMKNVEKKEQPNIPKPAESISKESPNINVGNVNLSKFLNLLTSIEDQLCSVEKLNDKSKKSNKNLLSKHGKYSSSEISPSARKTALSMLMKNHENSKNISLCPDLSLIAKSGCKIKMPLNSSSKLKFILVKFGKYCCVEDKIDFLPYYIPVGIECILKPPKHLNDNRNLTKYEVCIKSSGISGYFQLYFKVTYEGEMCGKPLKLEVRVGKKYDTLSTVPGMSSETPALFKENDGNYVNYAIPSHGRCKKLKKHKLAKHAKFVSPDLADEGIGGNQEDFYTPTDSDDTEVDAQIPKDEGIDTCYHSANFNLAANEAEIDSDLDSDSSISLLLDEHEVREKFDEDDLDVVKLPNCFVPNAKTDKEPVSVRCRRKMGKIRQSLERKDSSTTMNSAVEKTLIELADEIIPNSEKIVENVAPTSHDEQLEDFFRSIFPNSEGLKETVGPTKTPDKTKNTDKSNSDESATKETQQQPLAILPEKIMETASSVFKNVLNTIKPPNDVKDTLQQVEETISCVTRNVSNLVKSACPPPHSAPAAHEASPPTTMPRQASQPMTAPQQASQPATAPQQASQPATVARQARSGENSAAPSTSYSISAPPTYVTAAQQPWSSENPAAPGIPYPTWAWMGSPGAQQPCSSEKPASSNSAYVGWWKPAPTGSPNPRAETAATVQQQPTGEKKNACFLPNPPYVWINGPQTTPQSTASTYTYVPPVGNGHVAKLPSMFAESVKKLSDANRASRHSTTPLYQTQYPQYIRVPQPPVITDTYTSKVEEFEKCMRDYNAKRLYRETAEPKVDAKAESNGTRSEIATKTESKSAESKTNFSAADDGVIMNKILTHLHEMGFTDDHLNLQLLYRHNNHLGNVIENLLENDLHY